MEVCEDSIDQDCSGADLTCAETDADGDTVSVEDGDCDDSDATIYLGATEIEDDGIDQDCDGVDATSSSTDDVDVDGVTTADGDCDDADSTVYPGATELADAIDNDCDSRIDEGLVTANISSFPSSAAAGDSVDIDYDITNSSGLTEFEVQVLLNNDVVGSGKGGGSGSFPSRPFITAFNICTTGRCTELTSETVTATIGGATTSDTISATIPASTAAGDYTIRIRIHDASTGQYFTRDLETITVY